MSRRRGRPMRTYTEVSRELSQKAEQARLRPIVEGLVLELSQLHAFTHPECGSGCPSKEAIAAAREALGGFQHWALR